MMTRRLLLGATTALLASTILGLAAGPARAQSTEQASRFVESTARELQRVVNGSGSLAQKQAALQKIIDQNVDVESVGRFCLGRFWRTASPQQQREYLDLFHGVLMVNITSKVAEYQGVSFSLGRTAPRDGDMAVSTTVERPGNAPNRVDWLVSSANGALKIIDVIAEGTSLRLTQRSDYASYLQRNNNDVQALINALKQQVANGRAS